MKFVVLLSLLLTACGTGQSAPGCGSDEPVVCYLQRPTTSCTDLQVQVTGYGTCVRAASGEVMCECTAPHTRQPNGRCC